MWIQNVSMSDIKQGFHIDPGFNSMLIQIMDTATSWWPNPAHKFKEAHKFEFLDVEDKDNFPEECKISDAQAAEIVGLLQRALANNMGIASGPQVEVSVDRLPDGEDLTSMYPWKIWQTTSDRTGGGQPAVRFYQPNMNAETLMNVYQYFQKVADEVTGVPNYVYGSTQVSGAGRTAAGLSMLMENAAKGIKQAILSLDQATSEMLGRFYDHLMIYDEDKTIKGDMQIVASGVVGTLMKEGIQQRRNEFLAATLNPIDSQIIGASGRAYLLRETAKGLNMDVDKIVPSPEQIEAAQKAQEAQAQAAQEAMLQQQQQAEQAPPQPPSPME